MAEAFLRLPPFPGHCSRPLASAGGSPIDDGMGRDLVSLLKSSRVGGNFWGSQPKLPEGRDLIIAPSSRGLALEMLKAANAEGLSGRCVMIRFPWAGSVQHRGADSYRKYRPMAYRRWGCRNLGGR